MAADLRQPSRHAAGLVQHISVVHMLLVVTSVGLILVTLSAKSYNPAKALTQLEEIQRLQKEWSPEFLYARTEADVNTWPYQPIGQIGEKNSGSWGRVPSSPPYIFTCYLRSKEYTCKPHENWKSNLPESWSAASFPTTVSEFERFWQALAAAPNHYWVDFAYQIGTGTTIPQKPKEPTEDIGVSAFGASRKPDSITPPAQGPPEKQLWLVKVRDLKVADLKDCVQNAGDEKVIDPKAGTGKDCELLEYWDKPEKSDVPHEWKIPVLTQKRVIINHEALQKIFSQWKSGKGTGFDVVFADLSNASRGLEELEFADLREQLKSEATSGSGFFEIAGIKIPSEQVTTTGIIAVLGIQIYLLILLRELAHRLGAGDDGWDVPWIGMFGSASARSVTWVTVVAFPVLAVMLLAWQGISNGSRSQFVLVLPLLLSLLLASATWWFRPRAVPTATEPESS